MVKSGLLYADRVTIASPLLTRLAALAHLQIQQQRAELDDIDRYLLPVFGGRELLEERRHSGGKRPLTGADLSGLAAFEQRLQAVAFRDAPESADLRPVLEEIRPALEQGIVTFQPIGMGTSSIRSQRQCYWI